MFAYYIIFGLCLRIPIANIFHQRHCGRRKRAASERRKRRDAFEEIKLKTTNTQEDKSSKLSKNVIRIDLLDNQSNDKNASVFTTRSQETYANYEVANETKPKSKTGGNAEDDEYEYNDDEYDYDNYDYYGDYDDKDDCNDFSYLVGNHSKYSNLKDETENDLPGGVHCDFLDTLDKKCLEQSILEIWMYHEETVNSLTQDDILFAVNNLRESPYYGYDFNYSTLLGAITRNSSGHIVAARSALHHYITVVDLNNLASLGIDDAGTDPDATLDGVNYEWQSAVIDTSLKQDRESENRGVHVRVRMTRSFTDVSSSAIFFDMKRVAVCIIIMYMYTSVMLGRMDIIEQRFYLTAAGIASIALGMLVSIGITSAMGYAYSPHHALLPFVMIGIGVDDMFVIVDSWYNISDDLKKQNSLQMNIGLALRHAGVAITVTSATDFCAFSIGCLTMLSGLESFCLNCAIGIAAIYVLQLSWFVAWLAIDQKRIEERRVGILPCIQMSEKSEKPTGEESKYTLEGIREACIEWYTSLLTYNWYCILVILVTLGLLSVGIYGTFKIETKTEEVKNLPSDSYLRQWFDSLDNDFPELGQKAKLFTGAVNPQHDLPKFDVFIKELEELNKENHIIKDIDSWWISFKIFLYDKYDIENWQDIVFSKPNATKYKDFYFLFSDFLHSSQGGKYTSNIVFNGTLECNKATPNIVASSSDLIYQKFAGPKEAIRSVDTIENLIEAKNFSSKLFTSGRSYGSWEIDRVIYFELWRNLALATVCVFVITLVLLSNLVTSFLVLVCVIFTLTDVVGFLHLWGITVDVPSCSCIVMSVGLCVDYSAHIAHAFLVSAGKSVNFGNTSNYPVKFLL